ncbi:hypothetical protein NBRC116493_13400 [Aurantivibrio infirmus]
MKKTKLIGNLFYVVFSSLVFPSLSYGEGLIKFTCSWEEAKPIEIVIDTEKKIGTRSDGGKNYSVIKITDYAIWLKVNEPENIMALATQMIERSKPNGNKAGKWVDTVLSVSGAVSPLNGGICWEQ